MAIEFVKDEHFEPAEDDFRYIADLLFVARAALNTNLNDPLLPDAVSRLLAHVENVSSCSAERLERINQPTVETA